MVLAQRGPDGVIHRSDRDWQFFATLEREVINRRRCKTQAEARMAIFELSEAWRLGQMGQRQVLRAGCPVNPWGTSLVRN